MLERMPILNKDKDKVCLILLFLKIEKYEYIHTIRFFNIINDKSSNIKKNLDK